MHSSGFSFSVWVFVVHLCGLGLKFYSKEMWLPFIPARKRQEVFHVFFAGALWASWRCSLVDFNERNNRQPVWAADILSSDCQDGDSGLSTRTCRHKRVLKKDFVMYENGLLMLSCLSRAFSKHELWYCAKTHHFCRISSSFFSFSGGDLTRTNVCKKHAVGPMLLQDNFQLDITFGSVFYLERLKENVLY